MSRLLLRISLHVGCRCGRVVWHTTGFDSRYDCRSRCICHSRGVHFAVIAVKAFRIDIDKPFYFPIQVAIFTNLTKRTFLSILFDLRVHEIFSGRSIRCSFHRGFSRRTHRSTIYIFVQRWLQFEIIFLYFIGHVPK